MTFMEALNVTIVSMIIVFVLLAALMVVIYLQSYLIKVMPKMFKNNKKSTGEKEDRSEILNKSKELEEKFNGDMKLDDELQIVAAIMGTLSEYMGVAEQKIVIKSIKRVNSNNSRWANANLD